MTQPPVAAPRPRLSVREMQLALEAARAFAPTLETVPADVRSADVPDVDTEWQPEHDGPVSLTDAAVPQRRPRTTPRREATPRVIGTRRAAASPAIPDDLVTQLRHGPQRLVLVGACGGAGTTTATVLFAGAIAPVGPGLVVSAGMDAGSLVIRASLRDVDVDAFAASSLEPALLDRAGIGYSDVGTGEFRGVGCAPIEGSSALPQCVLDSLMNADVPAHVLIDWPARSGAPSLAAPPSSVLVIAPRTTNGLLAAELLLHALLDNASVQTHLVVIDTTGRAPRRAGRAALARLRSFGIGVSHLPYDRALADDPRVRWDALRPRTRTAVYAALTAITRED